MGRLSSSQGEVCALGALAKDVGFGRGKENNVTFYGSFFAVDTPTEEQQTKITELVKSGFMKARIHRLRERQITEVSVTVDGGAVVKENDGCMAIDISSEEENSKRREIMIGFINKKIQEENANAGVVERQTPET